MLKAAGKTVHVGGNIGHPLLAEAGKMREDDYAVLELSSFQLLTMHKSPEIAVVTNLAPNHLNVHKGMEEYVQAKANIFLHQSAAHKVILNYDNEITRSFAKKANSQVVFFSRKNPEQGNVIVQNGKILMKDATGVREILKTNTIAIPGVHNIENYMAAIAAVDGIVSDEIIRTVAAEFSGVEHRIQVSSIALNLCKNCTASNIIMTLLKKPSKQLRSTQVRVILFSYHRQARHLISLQTSWNVAINLKIL